MTPQTIKQLEQKYPFAMTKDEIIKEFQITKAKYKKWVGDAHEYLNRAMEMPIKFEGSLFGEDL